MTTIADCAKKVLLETDNEAVGWGDTGLLDLILLEVQKQCRLRRPFGRWHNQNHRRILNGLETQRGRDLFEKKKDGYDGTRQFYLREGRA